MVVSVWKVPCCNSVNHADDGSEEMDDTVGDDLKTEKDELLLTLNWAEADHFKEVADMAGDSTEVEVKELLLITDWAEADNPTDEDGE